MGPSAVTVGSLNVHFGRDPGGAPFDLGAAVAGIGADLLALQETWEPRGRPSPVRELADRLGLTLVQAAVMPDTDLHRHGLQRERANERGCWGLAVLTSLPVLDRAEVDLGLARGDLAHRRGLAVTVEAPGGTAVRLLNTHLSHRVLGSPVQLRRLARWARGGPPTVIAGDLNLVWPVTRAAAGYRRAVRGRTWRAGPVPVQLDHLLLDRRLEARDGEVLPDVGSDHRPVRCRLVLPLEPARHR